VDDEATSEPLRAMARRVARERARANAAEQALAESRRTPRKPSLGWHLALIDEVNQLRAALADAGDKEKILMRSIARLSDPEWWQQHADDPWTQEMFALFRADIRKQEQELAGH
jgi:hypothetical protein